MRRALVALCVLAAVVSLASPVRAEDWAMAGGDASRTRLAGSEPSVFPGVAWDRPLAGPLASEPIVQGGLVFAVASGPATIAAVTTAGTPAWTLPLSGLVAAPWTLRGTPPAPASDAARVFVLLTAENGTTDGHRDTLVALDRADGTPRGSFDGDAYSSATDPGIASSPLLAGDRVVFGSGDGHVRALYAANLTVAWDRDLGSPVRAPVSLLSTGNPLLGDFILAGDASGRLTSLKATGEPVWSADLGAPIAAAPVGTPAAALAAAGNRVVAVHPAFGSLLWNATLPAGVAGPIALAGATLAVGAADGKVRGLDTGTGATLWVRAVPGLRPWLVASPTRLFAAGASADPMDDLLLALDPASGDAVWSGPFPAPVGPASIADGVMYVGLGMPPRMAALEGSPDLAVRPSDIDLTSVPNPDAFQASVEVTVRNVGDAPVTTPFNVTVTDGPSGSLLMQVRVGRLSPSTATIVRLESWNFTAGTHNVTVVVDSVAGERSVANNRASITFYAFAGPPRVVTEWAPSFAIGLAVVAVAAAGLGYAIAAATRKREKELESVLRERRGPGA